DDGFDAEALGRFFEQVAFPQVPALHFSPGQNVIDRGDVFRTVVDQELTLEGKGSVDDLPGGLLVDREPAVVVRVVESIIDLREELCVRGQSGWISRGRGSRYGRGRGGGSGRRTTGCVASADRG